MKRLDQRRLAEFITKTTAIIRPLLLQNGPIDVAKIDDKDGLAYLVAVILNYRFASSDDKRNRSFGADDVVAVKLEVEQNAYLKYWGKISWLSTPKDHQCHRSFQDPFYGVFKLHDDNIELTEAVFGDYDQTDLSGDLWIDNTIDWMYDV
ncbi:MAG: hypothetical protein AB8F95_18865 [Bacteroidia bacterium]